MNSQFFILHDKPLRETVITPFSFITTVACMYQLIEYWYLPRITCIRFVGDCHGMLFYWLILPISFKYQWNLGDWIMRVEDPSSKFDPCDSTRYFGLTMCLFYWTCFMLIVGSWPWICCWKKDTWCQQPYRWSDCSFLQQVKDYKSKYYPDSKVHWANMGPIWGR